MSTAVLASFALLCACDGGPAAGQSPAPSSPASETPTVTPSDPSETPADSRTVAAGGAMAGYRRFVATVDAVGASGGKGDQRLRGVATGIMLGAELNQAGIFRTRKWHLVGRKQVVSTKTVRIAPPNAKGVIVEVTVRACLDSSHATAVDAAGKSVKKPGTPTRWVDDMRMQFVDGAWKAYYGLNKAAKC